MKPTSLIDSEIIHKFVKKLFQLIAVIPSAKHTLSIPDDPGGDKDSDVYTNIEEWLHQLAKAVENP